uniref:Major sperm protein n=1 Tax=Meloidogyne javanica TaxID=6303 RepID=A0A915N939_MELJA
MIRKEYKKNFFEGADIDNQNIGTLTVGEENTENCIPPYKYIELAESNQWSVEINKIELSGNKQLKNTKSKMFRIVEDGYYMYMPKEDLNNLAGILNAEIPKEIGGFYKLNITECKKPKPTITFIFGGPKIGSKHSTNPKEIITTTITLAPYQYIAPVCFL